MENLVVYANKKITIDKTLNQVKVVANAGVKRVLDVSVSGAVSTVEVANGMASVGGKMLVKVVYLTSENAVDYADAIFEFNEKQRSEFSLSEPVAKLALKVENTNVSDSEIVCTVSNIIEISGVYKYEIPDYQTEENSLVFSKKSFNFSKFVTAVDDAFVVAEESDCSIASIDVLRTNASAVLTEVSCSADKIIVEGKVLSEVLYKAEDGVGSLSREFEFKQEIAADKVVPAMLADAFVFVKNVTATASETNGKTSIVYAIDLTCKAYVYEDASYEIVTDMFSLKNELSATYDYLEAKAYSSSKVGEDMFAGQTDVSGIADFDDVVCVTGVVAKIMGLSQADGKVYANVEISGDAICKVGDELQNLNLNFGHSLEIETIENKQIKSVDVVAELVSFKVKAGKDLEINVKMNYFAKFENEISEKFVKSYEIKNEKENDFYGIKIYVSKQGQTVFDVAKVLNVKPEIIQTQNQVEDVFEQGQKIYVYSPVNLA